MCVPTIVYALHVDFTYDRPQLRVTQPYMLVRARILRTFFRLVFALASERARERERERERAHMSVYN